jgi:hypothetical protein
LATAAAGLGCGAAIAPGAAPAVSVALTALLVVLAHSPMSDGFAILAFAARSEAQRSVLIAAAGALSVRGGAGQHGAHALVAVVGVIDWCRGRLAAPVRLAAYASVGALTRSAMPSALRWAVEGANAWRRRQCRAPLAN